MRENMKMVRLSSKVRKACQGSSRGLTLIEVLIAIAILGIVAITITSALATAQATLFTAVERTTAESLARRQMEYIKSQGYQAESILGNPIYEKISVIPEGYSLWSVNRIGEVVEEITGIPWDSENNQPADTDRGLQKIALVIKYVDEKDEVRTIYTFINDNLNWADGVEITLEGYKVNR
jgi:prepilin-type N-terminal cleavage/methylation domain-containing protein